MIDNLNKKTASDEPSVRIHTVGYPVHLAGQPGLNDRAMRFAHLMRKLAEQNSGAFVGLPNVY